MDATLTSGAVRLAAFLAFLVCYATPAAGGSPPQDPPTKGALDGKVFVVKTGEAGKGADKEDDTLSFRDGRFHSSGCDRYGFGEGAYTSVVEGDVVTFEAVTRSDKSGTMTWTGTVQGDRIDGRYIWTDASKWYKPNPKPREYWMQGTLKES